jgi:hypothetical protein
MWSTKTPAGQPKQKGGMIFEFKKIKQAKAFTVAVKERFDLGGRVFTTAKEAALWHAFPWQQRAPVAHIDRAHWSIGPDNEAAWDAAWATEPKIEKLAKTFGGTFVGT